MRISRFFSALAIGLLFALPALALATDEVGPDSTRSHPTVEQPSWQQRIVALPRHESRVYSYWINGGENFYFHATPKQIGELIALFSKTTLRDHQVWIKSGAAKVKKIGEETEFAYNVQLSLTTGIARAYRQRQGEAGTFEPTLTVHVADEQIEALSKLSLPQNIILHNEVEALPWQGKTKLPQREMYHAKVQFRGGDSLRSGNEDGQLTVKITLWQKGESKGIHIVEPNLDGTVFIMLSEQEIKQLKSGDAWLTLTVGNYLTKAKATHLRLDVARLSRDKAAVKPIDIDRPAFYFGRILFNDGTPGVVRDTPWPGAAIQISFPYAGTTQTDREGFFQIYFTEEQMKDLQASGASKNIYVPLVDRKGTSRAMYSFPVSKLSRDKANAGTVRIPKPGEEL